MTLQLWELRNGMQALKIVANEYGELSEAATRLEAFAV
jgi:hypothetical protein